MDADDYQVAARGTALYEDTVPELTREDAKILYPLLGLQGETGELAEKIKKRLRGGEPLTAMRGDPAILGELGDVGWYFSETVRQLGFTLSEVFETNIAKLTSRQDRGLLHGEGDDR